MHTRTYSRHSNRGTERKRAEACGWQCVPDRLLETRRSQSTPRHAFTCPRRLQTHIAGRTPRLKLHTQSCHCRCSRRRRLPHGRSHQSHSTHPQHSTARRPQRCYTSRPMRPSRCGLSEAAVAASRQQQPTGTLGQSRACTMPAPPLPWARALRAVPWPYFAPFLLA